MGLAPDLLDEVTIARLGYAYCGACRARGCGDTRAVGDDASPDPRPPAQSARQVVWIGHDRCDGCEGLFREPTRRRRAELEDGVTDLELLDRVYGRP